MWESFLSFKLQDIEAAPQRGVLRKSCSENMQQIYRRTPWHSVISIKLQSNFIEIKFWRGCSPVNLLHIFRKSFSQNTSKRLLLGTDLSVTSLKKDSGTDVFLWILQKKNFSRKSSIVDVRLASKYTLPSCRYW